ncbi:stage II sporulation protein D [Bacillus haynesii]|uniref:stage II sporulation protein D n=1 Tax=Bacillus haynesii TaxID=1925021 RepID=UPI0015F669D1|nr:stage II sporulation protein D [Bacillus haynesii]MBU8683785.1 stage II sporulation protein D [Bacillus haynesii]MCY8265459.1 stage II sporulation protein D [Bacillus haynesii]MCY8355250.1 stage II sporulation protein D [Bacillus haynesii]MCY8436711.1 stage II sporulation protein D [Bacillus haynesii]MCY8553593.1 stage II sporulation protein D [Bacillus haynesii]
MKQLFIVLAGICMLILLIPTLLVLPSHGGPGTIKTEKHAQQHEEKKKVTLKESPVSIPVYRTADRKVEDIPLEEYVIGVVASEMPADFDIEALKAQALAARTYIVRQMVSEQAVQSPKGSLVDDTQMFQVYKNKEELRRLWKKDYDWKIKKVTDAVASTQGKILTYEHKPIDASFFSTSNGYTENAGAYWTSDIPYLQSVKSSWDTKSPKFLNHKTFTVAEFEQKLGVKLPSTNSIGEITERTPGKRVATAVINGKKLEGRDIREKLGLKSADFDWKRDGNQITVTTRGFGHGVGMSQYGAHYMAKDGKKAEEIVKYYYKGTAVANADEFLNKYMAKK